MPDRKDQGREAVLTPEEFTLIAEYDNAIRDLTSQRQGALQLMVRARKLDGAWALIGNKLVKQEAK